VAVKPPAHSPRALTATAAATALVATTWTALLRTDWRRRTTAATIQLTAARLVSSAARWCWSQALTVAAAVELLLLVSSTRVSRQLSQSPVTMAGEGTTAASVLLPSRPLVVMNLGPSHLQGEGAGEEQVPTSVVGAPTPLLPAQTHTRSPASRR
jgi:hypothetical protein